MIKRLGSELVSVALAIQFLTRLPVPIGDRYTPERFASSVKHYPFAGLLIGAIAAGIYWSASLVFPPLIAVLLSTGLTVLATGAFHEDGLADMADGIGGGLMRERALEIMKDSRIGTYGTVALLMVLSSKIALLVHLQNVLVPALIVGHALSRWSAVAVIASSDYVRFDGKAKPVARSISGAGFIWASLISLAGIAWLMSATSLQAALGAFTGVAVAHLFTRAFFERKLGGYTGDCLGGVQQLGELGFYLGLLACL